MAIEVASSSSLRFTNQTKYRYDVFLSFRGEDTRHNFTGSLYDSLWRKGINAFIDDKKLGKGEPIAPSLLKAIEKSRIAIIVFSTNYATSTWCLDELTHIMKFKKEKNQQQLVVIPIFYKVDPMDVLYVRNNFEKAMADHEGRFRNDAEKDRNRFEANDEDRLRKNMEKLQKWRSALFEAASLSSAWLFNDGSLPPFRLLPPRGLPHIFGQRGHPNLATTSPNSRRSPRLVLGYRPLLRSGNIVRSPIWAKLEFFFLKKKKR